VHGEEAPPSWERYRHAVTSGLGAASWVVAPTGAMLESLRRDYGQFQRASVIPNGRDGRRFHPSAVKEPFVVAAGRMWDEAQNLSALAAVAPALAWPVCVAGPLAPPGAAPPPLQPLGPLGPDALADVLGRASIYALPARYEPFGLTILEAALSGCALVLGDVPSLRELWGNAAALVPPGDTEAICRTLQRLIDNPVERARAGAAALRRARRFWPERTARAYLSLYRRLLGLTEAACA
jgi:glycosyltransferase involved in cell wall biosynthesis